MLKKSITYTDYDDVEKTEDFYFNLSKSELLEMQFGRAGGLDKAIQKIIDTKDVKGLIELFKDVIARSYGEKSDDGIRFIKVKDGHRLADDFVQTAAYDELFMELASDMDKMADFIKSIIPKSIAAELANVEIKA